MSVFIPKTISMSFKKRFFFSLVFFSFFTPGNNLLAQSWEEIKPGIAKRTFTIPMKDRSSLEINAVRIDPTHVKIKVINVYGTLGKQLIKQKTPQFPVYSLRELISDLNPQVIINGGFSASYSLPIPAGLLVENRKIVSHLNTLSETQSGIFCVGDTGFKIIKRNEDREKNCVYALQSGPMLIESLDKVGIYRNEREKSGKYRRSVVAIDKHGRLLLVASGESYLYDLATFLAKELDSVVALNLSGDEESGLYVSNKNTSYTFGNIDVPIASAIAVFSK